MAGAESLEWWHQWRLFFVVAGVACGLVLAAMLQGHGPDPVGPRP
jgi:hypothetical protein